MTTNPCLHTDSPVCIGLSGIKVGRKPQPRETRPDGWVLLITSLGGQHSRNLPLPPHFSDQEFRKILYPQNLRDYFESPKQEQFVLNVESCMWQRQSSQATSSSASKIEYYFSETVLGWGPQGQTLSWRFSRVQRKSCSWSRGTARPSQGRLCIGALKL